MQREGVWGKEAPKRDIVGLSDFCDIFKSIQTSLIGI